MISHMGRTTEVVVVTASFTPCIASLYVSLAVYSGAVYNKCCLHGNVLISRIERHRYFLLFKHFYTCTELYSGSHTLLGSVSIVLNLNSIETTVSSLISVMKHFINLYVTMDFLFLVDGCSITNAF